MYTHINRQYGRRFTDSATSLAIDEYRTNEGGQLVDLLSLCDLVEENGCHAAAADST